MEGEGERGSEGVRGKIGRVLFISAGASHSVALLSRNVVCSWGRGEDGQLGHGDAEDRFSPTQVSALDGQEIVSVSCGADHTTAYSELSRQVFSWGWGDFGRLGHGNSSDVFIPRPIKALYGLHIKQIACGDSHCLAVSMEGEVQSWGRNQNGQLGLGTTEDSLVPQKIEAFQGVTVKMVAAGAEHTVAITEDGELYGWGWGRYGNLGLGDRNDRLVPEKVACADEEKMVLVACGWRWGRYGNLGLGDRNDRLVPEKVACADEEKMVLVACGWRHTISVSSSGGLYTYGWSKYGQLGHGDFDDHLIPHKLEALHEENISQISGGWRHTMAVTSDGKLYGWGWNKFGQVGVGDNIDHCSPVQVKLPHEQKVVQISCGWRHTLAVTEKQNVFSWGRGTNGQLGHRESIDGNIPKMIEALSADGSNGQQIESSKVDLSLGKTSVSPSDRYAVVPDDNKVHGQTVTSVEGNINDASVPEGDVKRIRI